MVIGAGARKAQHVVVAAGSGGKVRHERHLAFPLGKGQRRGEEALRNFIEKRLDAGDAQGVEHGFRIAFRVGNERHFTVLP